MPLTARDLMKTDLRTVAPDLSLPDLERQFLNDRVSGFLVIEKGALVGLISRSDIVRQLCVERSLAEMTSDYYREMLAFDQDPVETFEQIAERVGRRIEHLKVREVMVPKLITVSPDAPLADVARTLVDHKIHRVPVTDEGKPVGIIATLDLARLFAEGRATAE